MDQVRLELTSSRLPGEVSLHFTTPNFVAVTQTSVCACNLFAGPQPPSASPAPARTACWSAIRAGQTFSKNRREEQPIRVGGNCPASCVERSNSSLHHPGIPIRWEQMARVSWFELLSRSCSGRSLDRSFSCETGGVPSPQSFPALTGTLLEEVTRTFTTPETLESFFLPPCLFASFLQTHVKRSPETSIPSVNSNCRKKIREESALTGFRVSNPSLSALPQKES
jgi:hypothetical protein